MRRFTLAIAGVALVAALGACSSDKKTSTTTTAAAATPTLPAVTTTTSPPSPYKATAAPTTGLKAGSAVAVKVSNFKAGLTLGINECAQKGTADVGGPDCALDHIVTIKVGADGTGAGKINVIVAKVGSANHNCLAADTRCFLSVGELSADPKAQRADDIDLKFG